MTFEGTVALTVRWLVRLSLCLPKRLLTRILRSDVPPLPVEGVGAPRAS